jgi:glycerol-3-phosphate O-acyltransferase
VSLQPVSITFDQLHEIGEYANYARGGRKAAEGMSWLLGFIKAQGERNFGKIYVRFPEPVSLRASLGAPGGETTTDEDARRLALQKTAFEVAWRINGATPVTSVALVTTVLLGTKGMALTTSQVHTALEGVFAYLDARHVPVVDSVAGLRDLSGVEATLLTLAGPGGVVTRVEGARDTVWRIETKNQLAATFYRNSIIHVFLISALCEIAMVLAAHEPADSDRVEAFWAHVHNLRDLLKFEFYFKDRAEFRAHVEQEVSRSGGDWEQMLRTDPVDIAGLLAQRAPLTASFMLRPFIEAYLIIADVVTRIDGEVDRPAAVKEGLALGEQFLAQKRIDSAEPVSALLFETGLKVMDNRGLLAPAPDRTERVEDFEQKLEQVLRAILEIERLTFDLFIADRRVRRGGR